MSRHEPGPPSLRAIPLPYHRLFWHFPRLFFFASVSAWWNRRPSHPLHSGTFPPLPYFQVLGRGRFPEEALVPLPVSPERWSADPAIPLLLSSAFVFVP